MMASQPGAVVGAPRRWLRLEGAAIFALATLLYWDGGYSWLLFAAVFFTPDLSFAAYLAGPRAGAAGYNVAHSYVGPVLLAIAALTLDRSPALALIWVAHIGFDRALGYGLKYPTGFTATHLGPLRGRRQDDASPEKQESLARSPITEA